MPAAARSLREFEVITHSTKRVDTGNRHEYYAEFRLKNTGSTKVDDFRVDIEFPLEFVNLSTTWGREVREKRTRTHMILRSSNPDPDTGRQTTLYPGDEAMLMSHEYFVTDQLHHDGALMKDVKITINSGDMPAIIQRVPMTELSAF